MKERRECEGNDILLCLWCLIYWLKCSRCLTDNVQFVLCCQFCQFLLNNNIILRIADFWIILYFLFLFFIFYIYSFFASILHWLFLIFFTSILFFVFFSFFISHLFFYFHFSFFIFYFLLFRFSQSCSVSICRFF